MVFCRCAAMYATPAFSSAKVVTHHAASDEFRLGSGIVRIWVDAHTHKELLSRRGVIKVMGARDITQAVDSRLVGHRTVGIVGHAIMLEPNTGCGFGAVPGQVDTPNQIGKAVCDQNDDRRENE